MLVPRWRVAVNRVVPLQRRMAVPLEVSTVRGRRRGSLARFRHQILCAKHAVHHLARLKEWHCACRVRARARHVCARFGATWGGAVGGFNKVDGVSRRVASLFGVEKLKMCGRLLLLVRDRESERCTRGKDFWHVGEVEGLRETRRAGE